jgi:phenylpropionate dioxygenase-like ring-hydroxylating dioxygenase large terminal subunit
MMESEFNFFQQWYPISPVEDLDPKRPTPVTLLGLGLVIWKPRNADQYSVFLDQCPHRLAPLSEGRVDEKTGHLMCSYHGWQFDPQGTCTYIPQAENPNLITKNRHQLCAVALPCQQSNGLLWVWPDAVSADIAKSKPLPLSPQIDASKGFVWSSFVRDLEYDWQTLVENIADPSHVPFAHHGVQGNRERARPLSIDIVQSNRELIEASSRGNFQTQMTFEPPCRLEYTINFGKNGRQVGLVTYCIPVSPGKSRIVAQFPRNFAKTLHRLTPRWFEHIKTRNQVLDGDMVLLHYQERILQQKKQVESWKTAYKLPTSADRFVIEFRNWFDKYCQGQLPWGETSMPRQDEPLLSNHEVLLDRYRQHTMICRSCRQALNTLQRLEFVLLGYFAVTVAGVAVMPDVLRVNLGLPLTVLALMGLGIYAWLKYWVEPRFYFVDYVHADR